MPDVHDAATRSRNMAAIRRRDTKPELIIRRGLHRRGFRFLLDRKDLPGRPDLVLPRYRAAVFVHGCFWHGHACHLFRMPETRSEFWTNKIGANRRRDADVLAQLEVAGWRTAVVWECALRGRRRMDEQQVFARLTDWIRAGDLSLEIAGSGCPADVQ